MGKLPAPTFSVRVWAARELSALANDVCIYGVLELNVDIYAAVKSRVFLDQSLHLSYILIGEGLNMSKYLVLMLEFLGCEMLCE